ncbi:hypothetical protein EIN_056410 [Entamoeba invadens IP1]|uniref:hypothetical protein n=1 Tax=Entamoeba invadens IP1 TaxID=370355 RepID=UPI0002C3DFA6|nr:hypothetical protein EIN_056410 [Entamoeba invadens IP1]ELP93266.1 hypothetical protein EIN_056410 [Entamoeba invadens IP1]|eukprot:XP_004260037.1 hypothetical protein EIN_056410 [Entamoeba invadens IP1]
MEKYTNPSTKQDITLLALADEGRVDLKSIIIPISYLRQYTTCVIHLFVEKTLFTQHVSFFNEMQQTFGLEIETFTKGNVYIANYRIKLYRDFLIKNNFKYNRVLHCDVSDVYFQIDPFQYIGTLGKLVVFKEGCDGTKLLEDSKNTEWYRQCYPSMAPLTKDSVIINAGVVMGSSTYMLKYFTLIWALMENNNKCDIAVFGPDQAVVEYAFHSGLLNELIDRLECGCVYCDKVKMKNNMLFDSNGCLMPFIHGRPPYYPQSIITQNLENYKEITRLV